MEIVGYIALAIGAYLLGSIPTGYLVARAKGIDIRSVGSGNIGATNVFRILGKPAGVFVLVFDGLKGFAACAWFSDMIIQVFGVPAGAEVDARLAAGIAAVLGHNFPDSPWYKDAYRLVKSGGLEPHETEGSWISKAFRKLGLG